MYLQTGSQLIVGSDIHVGDDGEGMLTIEDGASVSVGGLVHLSYGWSSDDKGILNLMGTVATQGFTWKARDAIPMALPAELNINGGTIQAAANNDDFFKDLGDIAFTGTGLATDLSALTFDTKGYGVTAVNDFNFVTDVTSTRRREALIVAPCGSAPVRA